MSILQGDIFFTNLTESIGSEQQRNHPVLVVSNNKENKRRSSVIVVSITAVLNKSKTPTHVLLDAEGTHLKMPSMALCEQVHTIDKSKIKNIIGRVNKSTLNRVLRFFKVSLDLIPSNVNQDCIMKRGDIFDTNDGMVLVVQNNRGNIYSGTTICVPIESNENIKKPYNTQAKVYFQTDSLNSNIAMCHKVVTMDKMRIWNKIGEIDQSSLKRVNKALFANI